MKMAQNYSGSNNQLMKKEESEANPSSNKDSSENNWTQVKKHRLWSCKRRLFHDDEDYDPENKENIKPTKPLACRHLSFSEGFPQKSSGSEYSNGGQSPHLESLPDIFETSSDYLNNSGRTAYSPQIGYWIYYKPSYNGDIAAEKVFYEFKESELPQYPKEEYFNSNNATPKTN